MLKLSYPYFNMPGFTFKGASDLDVKLKIFVKYEIKNKA